MEPVKDWTAVDGSGMRRRRRAPTSTLVARRPHPRLRTRSSTTNADARATPERMGAEGRVGIGWSTPWGAPPPEPAVEAAAGARRNQHLQISPYIYK